MRSNLFFFSAVLFCACTSMQGPQGPQGVQGPQGPAGNAGDGGVLFQIVVADGGIVTVDGGVIVIQGPQGTAGSGGSSYTAQPGGGLVLLGSAFAIADAGVGMAQLNNAQLPMFTWVDDFTSTSASTVSDFPQGASQFQPPADGTCLVTSTGSLDYGTAPVAAAQLGTVMNEDSSTVLDPDTIFFPATQANSSHNYTTATVTGTYTVLGGHTYGFGCEFTMSSVPVSYRCRVSYFCR